MPDRLRPLWDFDDLDATEGRLRARLHDDDADADRAEVLTQLARVEGLRDRFDDGDRLLDEAAGLAGDDAFVGARIDLERGRLRRSGGDPAAARPLFVAAYDRAVAEEVWWLAADAAHMVALAADGAEDFVDWTRRGIEIAEAHEDAASWAGPLLNNLGWELDGAGDREGALDTFRRALAVREREPDRPQEIEIARYAVGRALRLLGRSDEAVPLLETAVAWAEGTGAPDGWFHEELAEEYAALGRADEAAGQAALAIPLLERDDPSFATDEARATRLRELAAG